MSQHIDRDRRNYSHMMESNYDEITFQIYIPLKSNQASLLSQPTMGPSCTLGDFSEGYGFGAAFDFMGQTQYIEVVASNFYSGDTFDIQVNLLRRKHLR